MKKYISISFLCMQSIIIFGMNTDFSEDFHQKSVIKRTKKRELVSKVVLIKKASSNPILIAGSGEFPIEAKEGETIRDLIRSSDSLRDQGCSPSISDYI